MSERLIDSHVHLFDEAFGADVADVLGRARAEGIAGFVVPATHVRSAHAAVHLAAQYADVRAAVGIHPHEAAKTEAGDESAVERLSYDPTVVAIGEIGLDYFYDFAPKDVQQSLFRRQLEMAVRRNLPVIVHTRESMDDALRIVEDVASSAPDWRSQNGSLRRGVFHCFTGTAEHARRLFAAGFYVSYPGIVTFKNSPVLQTLKEIGLERVLIETDAPYLAPVPMRGKRNEPAYLLYTARTIAAHLGLSLEEVARATTVNAIDLFDLSV